jgi:hypothetical protein
MDLNEIVTTYKTEDVLSAILSMQYFGKGQLQETYLPAAELFASNAIRYNITNSSKKFTVKEHRTLLSLARNIFQPSVADVFARVIQLRDSGATDQAKNEFLQTISMKLKNTTFRGDGYGHQLVQVAEKLYQPFDDELKRKFGFTFTCFEKVIIHIIQKYWSVFLQTTQKITLCDAIKSIGSIITRKPPYLLLASKITTEFRIDKSQLYQIFPRNEIDCLFAELAISPGEQSLSPIGIDDFKPLYSKPFVDFGDYVYLPLPDSTLLNLPKLFHYYFVSDGVFDNMVSGKYNNVRGEVVEALSIEYLSRLFDKPNILQSLKYPKKQKIFEADVTVQEGNVTVLAECKSKILVTATLNGNITALKDDVHKAIGKAYEQAVRTIKYIRSGKPFYYQKDGADSEIALRDTPYKYILCVNIEHFGFVPSEITQYITIDAQTLIVPLAINVYDLDIITAECSNKAEFTQYLEFRRINSEVLLTVDELDAFGFFKKNGLVKITANHNGPYDVVPIGMMDWIDEKYHKIANSFILNKSTEYPTEL